MSAFRKLLPVACVGLLACKSGQAAPNSYIVFVCEHGAAKSVIASEYFNKLAAERGLAVRAIARGVAPQAALSVAAVKGLNADGMRPTLAAPRPLTAAERASASRIVAFDCADPAMKALEHTDACWDDVPTVSADYPRARDAVRAHVAAMIDQIVARSKS